MSKPYSTLRGRMKPTARKKAEEKTKSLLAAIPSGGCSDIPHGSVQMNQFEDIAAKEEKNNSPSA